MFTAYVERPITNDPKYLRSAYIVRKLRMCVSFRFSNGAASFTTFTLLKPYLKFKFLVAP